MDGRTPPLVAADVLARGSPDWVGPGTTGLVVILALLVAVIVLYRSMNKQLKRIRFRHDEDRPEADRPDTGSPHGSG